MRKLTIIQHITLDGVVQAPGSVDEDRDGGFDKGGWIAPYGDPAIRETILETHGPRFDLVLGRRTYDIWSGYWPTAGAGSLSDSLNSATKHVATTRPESLAWGPAKPIGPDLEQGVRSLKAGSGPDLILWGSASLPAPLLAQGLVDTVVLIVYPVLLGSGKRMLGDIDMPARFSLQTSRVTASGVVISRYVPSP